MEIVVRGRGAEYFTPNEVTLSIDFKTKSVTYEEVLKEGVKNVQLFVEEILIKNNFTKEDMKTRNFVIREEREYNENIKKYEFVGYSFSQSASLKFDYNKELIADMMVSISKLDNAPMCQISFGVKDEKECRRNILTIAYKDAENQARAIADASGKTLKYCQKVDFNPSEMSYYSPTRFNSDVIYSSKSSYSATQAIINTFTPEDIELTEVLYCLWIAE